MAKICVPICVERLHELESAIKRAAQVGDLIEIRFDYLDKASLSDVFRDFPRLRSLTPKPFILTFRPAEQGGHRPISLSERIDFWAHQFPLDPVDFADVEIEFLADEKNLPNASRVIGSQHDFAGVPRNLNELYQRMTNASASIIKISAQAADAVDCLPIFQLLEQAQIEGREMIAIAMGEAGAMTRILGPSRGSFLTYGSLDSDSANAPGQMTATEMRGLYRIDQIDRQTEILGIIGSPVSHSLSPRIHNASFAACERNAVYLPFEVRDVAQFLQRMVHPRSREIDLNFRGFSVTSPHKLAVMECLDSIDPAAEGMGSVNTIVVRDHQLLGYNTDSAGFAAPLSKRFGMLKSARCAIIGAGGAARACLWALKKEGAQSVLFARDTRNAGAIARQFEIESRPLAGANFGDFDIVVNATPLGTLGEHEHETAAEAEQLRGVRLAYDLVYNPIDTRFLREARDAGCATLDGIEMLLAQAVEQFRLWTGQAPDDSVMRQAAQSALAEWHGRPAREIAQDARATSGVLVEYTDSN